MSALSSTASVTDVYDDLEPRALQDAQHVAICDRTKLEDGVCTRIQDTSSM